MAGPLGVHGSTLGAPVVEAWWSDDPVARGYHPVILNKPDQPPNPGLVNVANHLEVLQCPGCVATGRVRSDLQRQRLLCDRQQLVLH